MAVLNRIEQKRCRKILGLSEDAGLEEVKRAFRQLAKKMHPDANPSKGSAYRFNQIRYAYDYLLHDIGKTISFPQSKRKSSPNTPASDKKYTDIFSWGESLTTSGVSSVRVFAARALGNSGRRAAYTFLRNALYDSDSIVVRETVKSIGKLGIAQSAGELASLFNRSDAEMKLEILNTVGMMRHLKSFQSLILNGIKDNNPDVKRKSMKLFFQYRSESGEKQR
jgi:curved DNA-binding protein CbpA